MRRNTQKMKAAPEDEPGEPYWKKLDLSHLLVHAQGLVEEIIEGIHDSDAGWDSAQDLLEVLKELRDRVG